MAERMGVFITGREAKPLALVTNWPNQTIGGSRLVPDLDKFKAPIRSTSSLVEKGRRNDATQDVSKQMACGDKQLAQAWT